MGNQADPDSQENVVGEVELALVAGKNTDTGETVPILTDNGVLQASITTPDGQYLTDTLASVGNDDLRVVLQGDNLSGTLDADIEEIGGEAQSAVDVANKIDKIEDVLASVGDDQIRNVLLGEDDAGTLQQSQVEALDSSPAAGTHALVTYPSRALQSQGEDELVSRVSGEDGVQVAEEEMSTDAAATDVALLTYPSRALQSQGEDELVSRLAAEDSTGSLSQVQSGSLGTPLGGNETALITYLSQALSSIGIDSVRTNPGDDDDAYVNAETLAADGEIVRTLNGTGAGGLSGQVVSTGTYNVELRWEDGDGNVIRTEEYAADVGAGTWTDITGVEMRSPHVTVAIVDTSSAEQTADATLHATG